MSKHNKVSFDMSGLVDAAYRFLELPYEDIMLWDERYGDRVGILVGGTVGNMVYETYMQRMTDHNAPDNLKAVAYLWAKEFTSQSQL